MRKIFLIGLLAIGLKDLRAQNLKIITANFSTLTPEKKLPDFQDKTIPFPDNQEEKFSEPTEDKIIVEVTNIPAGATIKLNGIDMKSENDVNYFDITEAIRNAINSPSTVTRRFTFTLKIGANPEIQSGTFTIAWTQFSKSTRNAELMAKGKSNRDKVVKDFRAKSSFEDPYNNKGDRIDLYFDENGKLLNHLPVNTDQNDIFYMHMVCERGDEEKYRINVVEGDYSPVDLAIRPYTKLLGITGSSTGSKNLVSKEYTSITLQAGPYTSDNFRFQIAYDSLGTEANGPEYKLKINKLFHVGVGVSLIRSSLEAPDYKTFYNGTDTTIEAFNGEGRTLFTFNVIWYWTIFHQKNKGSIIPNGRDVLKDEPTFSFTRLFPTLGVTIDEDFKENFFLGVVYEFARGGSFTAGLHYGRVEVLKDKNFVVGQTKFSGTDADIQLDKVYKTGFYFGINVDTRILNLLFSKGQ